MNRLIFLSALILTACNNKPDNTSVNHIIEQKHVSEENAARSDNIIDLSAASKTYNNETFKNVTVSRLSKNEFQINGQARVFEATFGWVIEDGHDELQTGYEMTEAGAPAFGTFSFKVTAAKKRPNSTLHLILFEISAKDGSRVHELPILLY